MRHSMAITTTDTILMRRDPLQRIRLINASRNTVNTIPNIQCDTNTINPVPISSIIPQIPRPPRSLLHRHLIHTRHNIHKRSLPPKKKYSAIPPVLLPSQPMYDYIGATYNPYEEQQTQTPPDARPQSQFELASHNAQEGSTWYGQIPQRVPRRHNTLKKVELFHGNFVLDSAVPSKLLNECSLRNEREFTHMRHSAATCDPNDFQQAGFTLRQFHYVPRRQTELFIVITMYNETDELFRRSMQGIIKNIAHLCKRDRSGTWGKDGWKKVVVCIVSDGRQQINSRTLSVLATMGVYQEGVAKVCALDSN